MLSVLYVDDDHCLLELGALLSEKSGDIDLDTARSAHEAIGMLASRSYECIISDYRMPEMDGIRFLQELRDSGNTIPFILFTSYDNDPAIREEAYRNGVFAVINKDPGGKNVFHCLMRAVYWAVLYGEGWKRPVNPGPDTRLGGQGELREETKRHRP